MISQLKSHPVLKIVDGSLVSLPCPSSLSGWWNFGSLLSLCLGVQISTGLFLALNFTGDVGGAFESVAHITQDVSDGWFLRSAHANGASFFFFCLYFHIGRGLYYGSPYLHMVWGAGVIILLMVMGTAFLGYVLPWGQMSFWGTTVITNLLSAIPYIGKSVVMWLWGGFAVMNPTLTRFFAFHFMLPFIVASVVMAHLLFLHITGSSNPLGLSPNLSKISFQPFFSSKDLVGAIVLILILGVLCMVNPWMLGDPENFICANPLVTPIHIQPEWYFLFAYAILRAIPNKLGGVIALGLAVVILLSTSLWKSPNFQGLSLYPISKWVFWVFISWVILLTWIGARPVEQPYVALGQGLSVLYFLFFMLYVPIQNLWDKISSFNSI